MILTEEFAATENSIKLHRTFSVVHPKLTILNDHYAVTTKFYRVQPVVVVVSIEITTHPLHFVVIITKSSVYRRGLLVVEIRTTTQQPQFVVAATSYNDRLAINVVDQRILKVVPTYAAVAKSY